MIVATGRQISNQTDCRERARCKTLVSEASSVRLQRWDFRWRLGGPLQFQFLRQQPELGFGLGIAGEQQLRPSVVDRLQVDHLDGGKLFQHAAWRQSRRQRVQAPRQRDVQAIGQEGDEDVGLDARLALVKDRRALPAAETLAAWGGQRGWRTHSSSAAPPRWPHRRCAQNQHGQGRYAAKVRVWSFRSHHVIAVYRGSEWAERGEI